MLGGHKYSTSCPKSSLESNLIHFFLYVSSEQHIPVIMSLKRIMFVRLLNHDARRLTQRVTHTAAMVIREKKISAWTPFYFKTMLLAYNLLFSHLFSLLLLFFFSFIQDLNEFYEYLTIKCDHWNNCIEGKLQLKRIIANYKLRKFVFESLWLSGRALEREIRRSEVRFLMGTFSCPTLVTSW